MAKVDTQSIPSEDRLNYKRGCQISTLTRGITYVRKRFPWRLPKMQAGGTSVSSAQKVQRERFIYVRNKYIPLSAEVKARWKDANPEYKSYLFGYNFFMLEGLSGGGPVQYPQMIKSIQVVKDLIPTTGTKSFAISTVDPTKCVVLIQGNSYISDKVQRGSNHVVQGSSVNISLSPSIEVGIAEVIIHGDTGYLSVDEGSGEGNWRTPYASGLTTSQLTVSLPAGYGLDCYFSWEIIEHKAQTVYPVLVSIAANAVIMDWALVPSVPAYVSITVVEYL